MHIHKKACRCCAQDTFERLGSVAEVSQFFLQYGLQISITVEPDIISIFLKKLEKRWPTFLPKLLPRIRRYLKLTDKNKIKAMMPCGLCSNCTYLAPWPEISNDHLLDYYSHYLNAEYKDARIKSQPGYAVVAPLHGSPQEFLIRRKAHTELMATILNKYAPLKRLSDLRLLDYGGGDGGIQPMLDISEMHTYDVGDISPPKSFYDVVQCMHVLEHVGNPLATCRDAFECLKSGGLFYVEVPFEFMTIEDCLSGNLQNIDEHINKFSINSVRALLEHLSSNILLVEEGSIEILHLSGSAKVIRGLVQKN
jgi:hypothetical protein